MFWPRRLASYARRLSRRLQSGRGPCCREALYRSPRNLRGSAGVSFATALPAAQTQFHHAWLAEHIAARSLYGWHAPLAPVAGVVQAQASIMGDLDIFWLLGVLAWCLWPLVLFLPRMANRAAPAH